LRGGKTVFHLRVFQSAKVAIKEAITMIENSTIVNMVGENVVKKAIERRYVHPEAVLDIEGVRHAQMVKFRS
jgi:hypothetical protein